MGTVGSVGDVRRLWEEGVPETGAKMKSIGLTIRKLLGTFRKF